MAQHGIDLIIREALSQIERPEYAMLAFLRSGALLDAVHEIDRRLAGSTMTVDHIPMAHDVILEFVRAYESVEGTPPPATSASASAPAFFPGPVVVLIPPPNIVDDASPTAGDDAEAPPEESSDDAGAQELVSPDRIAALREHFTMVVLEGLVQRWKSGEMSARDAVARLRSAYPSNP